MDPLTLGLLALLALSLSKGKGGQQQQEQPQGPNGSEPSPQLGGGGGVSAGDIVGAVGSTAAAAGAVVGAVKGVAATLGGGGAATAATGGTAAATGGTTAAASGTATTAGTTAAGVSGAVVAANVGIFALILAIEIAVAYVWVMVTETAAGWRKWSGGSPLHRCAGLWFLDEQNTIERFVDPSAARVVDPATGKAPPTDGLVGERTYVKQLDYGGFFTGTYVPVASSIKLPAAEVTRLYRAARYLAIEKVRAYNACEFWFWANGWNDPAFRNPRGVHPGEFDAWVQEILRDEPWAEQLTWRGNCGLGQLEDAARSLFVPNFEQVRAQARFQGRVMALTDCAITGYPFTGVWPGDETFSRTVVRFCDLGGAPMLKAAALSAKPAWAVDEYWVAGGRKWVAVDPVTNYGLDVQGSRGAHGAIVYSPEQLQLERRFPAQPKFTTQPAQAEFTKVDTGQSALPAFGTSSNLAAASVGSFKA
jgi:hypothetical protein